MDTEKFLKMIKTVGNNTHTESTNKGKDLDITIYTKGRAVAQKFIEKNFSFYATRNSTVIKTAYTEAGIMPVNRYLNKDLYYTVCFCKIVTDMIDINNNMHKDSSILTDERLFEDLMKALKSNDYGYGLRDFIRKNDLGANMESILEFGYARTLVQHTTEKLLGSLVKDAYKRFKIKKTNEKNM